MKPKRKFHRELVAYARELGVADATLVPGGKHPRIVGSVDGRPFSMTCPSGNPTEWHAMENAKKNIRRRCEDIRSGA
jgi:hypothetical protein